MMTSPRRIFAMIVLALLGWSSAVVGWAGTTGNPILHADVPDIAMIRVGGNYYMSSTTMHMNPGLPIMKSTDLVNWKIIGYAHDQLDACDALDLKNGQNAYGGGSWASSLRFHQGTYYVTTFAGTTGKTYVYSTRDIEKGPWQKVAFKPKLHDHSLFFDDDGKAYMVHGAKTIQLVELMADLSGPKPGGLNQVIIENASAPAGANIGLQAEGSQLFKVNGRYYLFNITWPKGGMRTVVIHRADKLTGPYEGRVGFQDGGVAQGGLIDTPDGKWFAYLFQDCGAVGRVPFLVPVDWQDGWPVIGNNGRLPEKLDLPANKGMIPGIVASDEFERAAGAPALPLVWQWNHNPEPAGWSVARRPGFLRLTTIQRDDDLLQVRNMLTQRTIGPKCSAVTRVDTSGMSDGDRAGLCLLQKNHAWVGVKREGNTNRIVMVRTDNGRTEEMGSVPMQHGMVHLRADCDFTNRADTAVFFYSLDGITWVPIGGALKMSYTIPHFMGYRFGLFSQACKSPGGHADFDFFRIRDSQPDNGLDAKRDPSGPASLRDAFADNFLIGAALGRGVVSGQDSRAAGLAAREFSSLTAENDMKWESIQPRPGQYQFAAADQYAAFAESHRMAMIGHTLVWHNQTPAWVFIGEDGGPASRGLLLKRLRDHIHAVVGRYKGRVKGWDVVNEALADGGPEPMRDSPWRRILGDDFLDHAFRFAREADPAAELYYNDYGLENPRKRDNAVAMLKGMLARGVPVTGVGTQSHFQLEGPPIEEVEKTIRAFAGLGLKVMITELDVDVLPARGPAGNADITRREQADAARDPFRDGLPEAVQQKLARRYAELFEVYLRHRQSINRVTFWGLDDGRSWLNNFPVRGRVNHPLLFDRGLEPKAAYFDVLRAAAAAGAAKPVE